MARVFWFLASVFLLAGCTVFRRSPTRMDNPRYVYYHPGFQALRAGMRRARVVELLGEPQTRSERKALEPLSPAQRAQLLQEQKKLGRAWNDEFARAGDSHRLNVLAARRQKITKRLARSVERWECRPHGWEGSVILIFDEKGGLRTFECGMG